MEGINTGLLGDLSPILQGDMMNFISIDVETANADYSSICQVGLAQFRNGEVIDHWNSYVDPEDDFDPMNISIHGINESTVAGAPTFPEIADRVSFYLKNFITVCHTHFDRTAFRQAFNKYAIQSPECTWLDSASVARRTWQDISRKGYGLVNVCSRLGYSFQAHDALEDAKAAGYVLIKAINETGLSIEDWLKRVRLPIDGLTYNRRVIREGNPLGHLYGELLVFTGTICLPRAKASELAAEAGCDTSDSVTKDTTILVVGDQDLRKLAGHTISSKQHKAETMRLQGHPIRIIQERDFLELIKRIE